MDASGNREKDSLAAASNALKTGDLKEARRILRLLAVKDPRNVAVWELFYQASYNDDERMNCLRTILKLAPGHEIAAKALSELEIARRSAGVFANEAGPSPEPGLKQNRAKKRRSSRFILASIVGFAVFVCAALWLAVFYRWGLIPLSPSADQTRAVVAADRAACQVLIDRALSASSDHCNRVGSDQACYGNNTVSAHLVPGAAQQFAAPGDIIGVSQIESISASVLNPALNEWGIAIFKVISNLPRSLPGETVTLVVFGNTTLENSGSLETYYFYSGVGQVACDQIPFDGLMVTMPEGTGIHFVVNGAELTLMGNASLKAVKNGSMDVTLYSGSGSIESDGQKQIFGAGESVSVPLGGPNGVDPIGPPSAPQPLSPDDLSVACSMTRAYCDPADITPVPTELAAQMVLTADARTATATQTFTLTPSLTFTITPSPTATLTPSPSLTLTSTLTPTRTSTRTRTPTRSSTPPPPPPPANTNTPSVTPSLTLTPSLTFTPSLTHTLVTGAVVVQIVDPASDGALINNNAGTSFEAQAWDTAVGTTNGDGIDHVNFWFTYGGSPISPLPDAGSPQVQSAVRYCAFTGTGTCLTVNGWLGGSPYDSLPDGTYTMYVQAWGVSGDSGVITRTFEKIP